MRRLAWIALVACTLAGSGAPRAAAQAPFPVDSTRIAATTPADSALEARTREVASQLRCPVCQGISIQDSPSELAQDMRDVVRQQLRAGRTPDEVKAYFVGRYGDWILLEPPAHGFTLLVYALPIALLLAGGGILVVALRRWVRASPAPPAPQFHAPPARHTR